MAETFRGGQQPEILRDTEGKLPEAKIFDLLSSIGNGEHKALELILMRKGVIYSRSALYKEVMGHQVEGGGWRMNKTLPFAHCQSSLSPIGLVTKEALSEDATAWGYEITQYGLSTGVPFAGRLLKWSYEHPNYSLYKMFSSTNSPSVKDEQTLDKKRAQETRYKIFWEIITNPNKIKRHTDIVEGVGEDDPLIYNHLVALAKNGVISYESVEKGKPIVYFRLKEIVPDQEPKPYHTDKMLSARAYSLLTQLRTQRPREYLSIKEISNALIQEYPEYEDIDRKSTETRVGHILSNLALQGHVERRRFDSYFKSELTLSIEQIEAITSLITLIDKFKNGDRQIIEEGRRFAQKVANDPSLFGELMFKAKQASPKANSTAKEDTEGYLISIARDHPNSTVNQVCQFLEEDYDKRLTTSPIRRYLSSLVRQGKIIFETTKSGNVYRVVEEGDKTTSV